MTFRDFIKDYGELKLAQKLKVSLNIVKFWRYENGIPRPKQVKKIILLTNYRLSWEDLWTFI
tara:strand:+ start:297 stop:482 length:186 start_codon:yes stop_codon:yes gene_type:complete